MPTETWSSMPLSRQRRACVPRAPGTRHVTRVQLPQHTGAKTKPLLRGGLAPATWRPSWGSNQGCPTGDDAQPGLGHGGTAYPGRGHLVFPPHSSHSCTRARAGTCSDPRVHAHTHTHAHTGVQSHSLTPTYTHTDVHTLTHSHSVSLQGLDTEGKQYRAGKRSRGHLF